MSNTLIGGILILLGIGLILDLLLPLPVPVFKIAFALMLVYWGVRLSSQRSQTQLDPGSGTSSFFAHTLERPEPVSGNAPLFLRYNTIAAKSTLDLTRLYETDVPAEIEIFVAFGEQVVKIPREMSYQIRVQAVFAGIEMPDGPRPGLGTSTYHSVVTQKSNLKLGSSALFSSFKVELV